MGSIVCDDAVRSGEPRLEGTRITVRDVKHRVIGEDEDPHVVAGEYGISLVEFFGALAYYYEQRESVEEREAETRRRDGERQTRELLEQVQGGESHSIEQAD
ncbi:DUF433 domain-containing protein [Halarchaeum sp. P4]|uniref:DUF433 domain-containing protein n=1 Tax=Halarchaeum sp. P4 TaxID=3421639 RepID=UPI003EBF78B7